MMPRPNLALATGSLFVAFAAAAATPPTVCPLVSNPPVVDGRLGPAEWSGAAVVDRFHGLAGETAPAATRVLLVHDDRRLYLAADLAFRPGHVAGRPADRDDDGGIWEDDCLEVFLAPDPAAGYCQLIVNSLGRLYDASHGWPDARGAEWNLTPRPAVAAKAEGGRLVIEMAVDFAALGRRPEPGDVWGFKLARTHWDRTPTTRNDRPGNVFTSTVVGGEGYHGPPWAALVFTAAGRQTEAGVRLLAGGGGFAAKAHLYHRLEEARRTNVWAKPCEKLFRDGAHASERLIYRDTGTGAEVWRVTFNSGEDGVSYANVFPWNANGSLLHFSGRERMQGGFNMLMSADGERIWQPKAKMLRPRWSLDDPDAMLCAADRRLVRADVRTGKQTVLYDLPADVEGVVSFDSHGLYAVACKQGFGEGGKLTLIDLTSGERRPVALRTASEDFKGDWLYSGHVTRVGDQVHVGYSLNHLPHLSREHPYQQWVMNLKTGEYRQVKYLSHGGTSPLNDRKVGYWGGEICITDWFGEGKRTIMRTGTDGHIPWMSSPEWCLAGNSGAPNSAEFACQLVQVFVDTGNWRRIAYGQTANSTYASNLFANTSPDGTKGEYTSTMLGPKCIYWAVIQRPKPPSAVKAERSATGARVSWTPPAIRREIKGYRVWRAEGSGGPYALVSGREPVAAAEWLDAEPAKTPDKAFFYVVTSMEHSTLESRCFSPEAAAPALGRTDWPGEVRRYVEAESGAAAPPVAEDFSGSASCDAFVAHRHGEGEGVLNLATALPRQGRYALWARVRGSGEWRVQAGGSATAVRGDSAEWAWRRAGHGLDLAAGVCDLRLSTRDKGLAVDKLLLTDDQAMTPRGMGDTTRPAPAAPAGLKTAAATRFDVSLVWQPAAEPEFHHYQVYRGREPGFRPGQEALVGSPSSPAFLDWGLEPGKAYHYAVTAVDTFGHESEPARLSAQTEALARRVLIALEAETGVSRQGEAKVERHAEASAGVYLVTPVETVTKTPYRLELPFEAPLADRYVVWVSCFPVTDEHVFFNVGMDGKVSALFYCHNSRKGAPAQRLVWRPLGALSGPTPLIWNLDQGPHAVTLSLVGDAAYAGRVFALDRVIVTNDLSFVPPGRVWDWQATPEAGKP